MKKIYFLMPIICLLVISSCKKKTQTVNKETTIDYTIYKKGATIYGAKNYVHIIVGDLNSPIILASPHDGVLEPSSIPTRSNPDAVLVRDIYVTDLTTKIADSIAKLTGLRPHVIINDLSRKKMEPNRSLDEAYLTHPDATQAWNEYQDFIKTARNIVQEKVGKGLFIDMHGHGHDISRIEIGYLLSKTELNGSDELMNFLGYKSSIYGIAKNSSYSFSQLIRGNVSLGNLLNLNSCPSIPSSQDPKPNNDEYFNGGYCTLTYGSRNDGGTISAVQFETPGPIIRNTAALRTASSGRMARAIITYMKLHYGLDLMKPQ